MVILMFTTIIPTTNTNNSRQALNKVYTWISMRLKYSYHLGIYLLLYLILYKNVSINWFSIDLPLLPQCNGWAKHAGFPLLFLCIFTSKNFICNDDCAFLHSLQYNRWLSYHACFPLLFSSPPARILIVLMIAPHKLGNTDQHPALQLQQHIGNLYSLHTHPINYPASKSQSVSCPHIHVAIPALWLDDASGGKTTVRGI